MSLLSVSHILFLSLSLLLSQQIFSFLNSENLNEKKGGIRAILQLITCPSATTEHKADQFSRQLSFALKNNTDFQVLELIAVTFGQLAKYAPVSQVESVEAELIRSLEWLRGPSNLPHRRLAACALLHELAENAPTIFFVRCKEFFELIWGPLRDPKEAIRLCAARALSSSLSALEQRTYHLQWYCAVYEQVLLLFFDSIAQTLADPLSLS
jgi:serine/threonine-protein kinase mTOR